MRATRLRLVWMTFVVAIAPGCLFGNPKAVTAEYVRQVTVSSARTAQIEQAMIDIEARLKYLEEITRKQGQVEAERLENLDQVNAEIGRLRGKLEEIQFVVEDMHKLSTVATMGQERRQLHDEARLSQIEGYLGITPPVPPTLDDDPTASTAEDGTDPAGTPDVAVDGTAPLDPETPTAVPEDAAGKLDLAVQHMKENRQALARVILQKAITEHSGAPELAEIRYRIGETWFNEAKWAKAVGSFEAVNTHHRKSDWAAWAMLRQGECFKEMGQPENATLFYQEVVRQHPKTDAAKEAKSMLASE